MQTEYQLGRPLIWPILKRGRGLQALSKLYASVLEERKTIGRITSPSTFRPPPRVTLTDTKREIWLRDLSNNDISLRKLSRTIPHGIRGKGLLEQCLSKSISIERCVWLCRCVGANEIRAFRRKRPGTVLAVGGESKWIKEWTSQVELFIESIVANCGEPDWAESMAYT